MTYKGWSNYETWSVNLWADRRGLVHGAKLELLDDLQRPVSEEDVRVFFLSEMDGTTPDLDHLVAERKALGAIDFAEIAEQWERERQFRHELLGL